MTLRSQVSTYFGKTVSGFVANKFIVEMSAMNMETLKFYVKKVSIPYETLTFTEDIYVSDVTLAKPKNTLMVQTPSEISMVFRMDPENAIIKRLETIFASTHNVNTFEVAKNPILFTTSITLYGTDYKQKYANTFYNCSIVHMENYDLDMSDRKLKEYNVTILCNRIAPSQYTSTISSAIKMETSCQELIDKFRAAMRKYKSALDRRDKTVSEITTNDVDRAFSESNVINIYVNLLNNSGPCRWDEKFPIGMDFTQPIKDYIQRALLRNHVPQDHIDFNS